MDLGVLKQDGQIYDLIIKSNIVKEMPIYNNLIRATLLDKMEEKTLAPSFRKAMKDTIIGR